jgi:hypothetical protein
MKIYHGSTGGVAQPALKKCRAATDFGKGFYTTTNPEQAKKWAVIRRNRAGAARAIVTEYEMDDDVLQNKSFKVRSFDAPTEDWLNFVMSNRMGRSSGDYDFVMGPVANDSLYATLLLYEQGILSANAAIEQLKTHTLFDQLSFHSNGAIAMLRFVRDFAVE